NDVGLLAEEYDPHCGPNAGQLSTSVQPCRARQHSAQPQSRRGTRPSTQRRLISAAFFRGEYDVRVRAVGTVPSAVSRIALVKTGHTLPTRRSLTGSFHEIPVVENRLRRRAPWKYLMPFKVKVGPHQISIHHGQTVLVGETDGQIHWPSEKGLYFFDTRVISSWTIYANGESWELLNGGAITPYASRICLTNRAIPTADGIIPQRTLGLVISRLISEGMHEDLDVTNNSMRRVDFQLELALRCDFADIFE